MSWHVCSVGNTHHPVAVCTTAALLCCLFTNLLTICSSLPVYPENGGWEGGGRGYHPTIGQKWVFLMEDDRPGKQTVWETCEKRSGLSG